MTSEISLRIKGACTFFSRLGGWFGRTSEEQGVWLYPCRIIHTIGMKQALNLLWIDAQGNMVREDLNVAANQIRVCWKAASVFEVASEDVVRYRALREYFTKGDARD
ncbi:hypothetical protein CWE11_08295 [Aliidiomarina sanyensis]|uniref:DUF192 domain-containing protein n=1 Tax=Aliidiomarina sanyensis TaxID=1249555 RepID=A0A432WEP6_9GAMM|nr:hypothetical protein CWE11_08295 [Aliidiomarina sanyensis]